MFKNVFKTGVRGIYNVSDNSTFSTDMWAIYPAKHKQTGKMVSVFIFEKPRFEAQVHRLCTQTSNTRNPRIIVTEYYEKIRIEISQLTKLKHPQILTVLEVMEETKSKFLFVTEPVTANLATLDLQKETSLSIQKGLLEISKGLQFLHDHCSIIHMNLQPSSVFVNTQGDWKLAGFKFLQNLNELAPSDRDNFYIMNSSSVVEAANYNLNFTAPELILDSAGARLSTANDMWALGMLIYYLYNKGDLMINCFELNSVSDFKVEFRKFESKFYNHRPSELKYMFKEVPESLWTIMTQLLARYPNDRMSISQFIDSDFSDSSLIKMMWFIEEFTTKTTGEKIVFLDGLLGYSDLLHQLPSTFRNSKLLPLLVDAINSEVGLLSSKKLDSETDVFLSKSLLLVFAIGGLLSNLSFQDKIYDGLLNNAKTKKMESSFLRLFQISVKVRLAIISNTDLFLKKLTQKQVIDLMKEVPTLCVTVSRNDIDQQADQIKLQDAYLSNLSSVVELLDFPYIKNTLLPLICQVFKTTTILSTKIQTIKTFDMLVAKKIIDISIVTEQLLPVFDNLKSRDKRIVGAVIAFFTRLSASQHIALDLETMVERILGQCLRLIFGCSDCSKSEFKELIVSLKKIEDVALDEKLKTLSDVARNTENENFSALLNSTSVRQKPEERIKEPVLQPTSAGVTENTTSPQKHITSRVKPLTLTSSRQDSGLRFGATTTTSGTQKNLKSSPLIPGRDLKKTSDFTPGAQMGANKSTSDQGTSLDWSSAETSYKSAPTSMNSTILQPQNTSGTSTRSSGPSWAPLTSSPGQTSAKLPPGFSADILTPNSNKAKQATPKLETISGEDLLDFL